MAIGAAAAVTVPLGVFLLLTFAVHNVSEGVVLGAALTATGRSRARAVTLSLLARAGQAIMTALAFQAALLWPACCRGCSARRSGRCST